MRRAPVLALAAVAALGTEPASGQPVPPAPVAIAAPAGGGSFLRASDYRVQAIVFRLGAAGRALCPEPFPLTGLAFHHLAEYGVGDRPRAIADYGIDRGPGILSVIEGSPAARAGFIAGDVVVAVNGAALPSPTAIAAESDSQRWRPRIVATEIAIEDQLRLGPGRLDLIRQGRPLTLTLAAEPGCPARGRLARSSQDNAFADGRYTIMTTGFLDFFRTDSELAVALAHELAHNILRHPQQLEAQGVPYGMMRHIGRNARLVRATEMEADRLSVRLLHAAGYDLDSILPFWQRVHGRLDSRLAVISAHPGRRAQEQNINAVIAEIRGAPPPAPR